MRNSRKLLSGVALLILSGWLGQSVQAELVQIGSQHFTDGQIINVNAYSAAVAGQPAPFNAFQGSDLAANLAVNYTFNFAAQPVTSATFTLGIFDHDSAAGGAQVKSFSINNVDLVSQLSTAFESKGGTQFEYNIYTITLPTAVLATLATGRADVVFTLAGPGLQGDAGNSTFTTAFNGAGLDFSNLNLNSGSVPEPSSCALLGLAGMLGWGVARARRRLI